MLTDYTPSLIELPVADRVFDGTTLKQRARYDTLTIRQTPDGNCTIHLLLLVSLYAVTADGDFGPQLTGKGLSSYHVTLIADNNTAVDVATGDIRFILLSERTALHFATQQVEQLPAVDEGRPWRAFLHSRPEQLMLQGDFFCLLRDTQDVRIANLITQHIAQADAMGKFS